ncbi:MAG: trypsin-like peptidase domain-containing protein [Pseudomonadota bacterium]
MRPVLAFVLLLQSCSTAVPATPNWPHIIAEARPAVFGLSDGQSSIGTGFAVASDLIVTNAHVASGSVYLQRTDRTLSGLTLLRIDEDADLALLQLTDSPPALGSGVLRTLSPTRRVPRVGEPVLVLGNPFGLGVTASTGIVSALGKAIGRDQRLQIDAAVNPGNSGGPLLDSRGMVIGIVNARAALGSGVAFAVPMARLIDLIESGKDATRSVDPL